MRYINNRMEPDSFANWKRRNGNGEWYEFSRSDTYHELREYLIATQEQMCCYCEIALKKSIDAHIEHLKNRDHHPNQRFDFNNLYASCQHTDSCGHKKGNQYFNGMVLPNTNDPSRFTYTDNGKIIPVIDGDGEALKTIEILGLNNKRLKNARKDIIRIIDDINDAALVDKYLKNCVEWVNGFFTVVEYVKSK
ncbi:retron system putative HNH endonuclease [Tenacibaculum maritimum]|uniref:retron system putative HNH endonuclease n=1 Tax=Tenacibaculum maritimum TaxID=107401 RepID=UPI0038762D93